MIGADGNPMEEIRWDGSWQNAAEAIGASFVQQISVCGYPNPVFTKNDIIMLADEDGLLKHLAVNPRASRLYGVSFHGHRVVGHALLIGLTPTGWTDLPEQYTPEAVEALIHERTRKP